VNWTSKYSLIVTVYAVSVMALLTASFFPHERIWGFNWYAYFGWDVRIIVLLVALTAPLILTIFKDHKSTRTRSTATKAGGKSALRWAILISVAMMGAFFLFRGRTHFLGDGFQLLYRLAEGTYPIRPWNPAVYWIQGWVYGLLGGAGLPNALLAFQLISYVSGLLFLALIVWASWRLFEINLARLLFFLGVISGGYMLVFFGYVENYPMFILAVSAFSLLGLLAVQGKIGRWWFVLPLAVAIPLHPFSASLAAPAVYLMFQGTRVGSWVASRPLWVKIAACVVLLAGAIFIFQKIYETDYFFRFAIVPFVKNRFTIEGYWMFGGKHLADYISLIWQYQPGILIGIIAVIGARHLFKSPEYILLGLQVAASFGIAFLFDPKLGMPRDWDMFCFAGVPLTILILLAALDVRVCTTNSLRAVGLIAALGLIVLAPRVAVQAIPDTAIAMFDNYSDLDSFKCFGGRYLMLQYLERRGDRAEAERRRTANVRTAPFELRDVEAQAMMGRREYTAAVDHYRRLLENYPGYHNAWTNLGICHYQLRQCDSAIACLRIADGLNPFSVNVYHYLALAYYTSGDETKAEDYWLQAKALVPGDYRPYEYLLLMYDQRKRQDDYNTLADEVVARSADTKVSPRMVLRAAEILAQRGNLTAAQTEAHRALALGLDTVFVTDLQRRYPRMNLIGCK
jgi:tetratricopeptide (TPR) repeat protein